MKTFLINALESLCASLGMQHKDPSNGDGKARFYLKSSNNYFNYLDYLRQTGFFFFLLSLFSHKQRDLGLFQALWFYGAMNMISEWGKNKINGFQDNLRL